MESLLIEMHHKMDDQKQERQNAQMEQKMSEKALSLAEKQLELIA